MGRLRTQRLILTRSLEMSASRLPFQPVDATLALPVSAGVFTPPVRGQLVITSRSSILHTLAQLSAAPLFALSEPITPPSLPLQNLWGANYKMAWDHPRNQRLIAHVPLSEYWLGDLGEPAY